MPGTSALPPTVRDPAGRVGGLDCARRDARVIVIEGSNAPVAKNARLDHRDRVASATGPAESVVEVGVSHVGCRLRRTWSTASLSRGGAANAAIENLGVGIGPNAWRRETGSPGHRHPRATNARTPGINTVTGH